MRFAVFAKDVGDRPAFIALDFLVEINESPAEFLCQAPADSGFASAHEADQINATNCHSGHCTGSMSFVVLLALL